MNKKNIGLLIVQAEIILEHARKLQGQNLKIFRIDGDISYYYFLGNIDKLIVQYNYLVPKLNKLFLEESIDEELKEIKKIEPDVAKIRDDNVLYNPDGKLLGLIFNVSKILTFLREGIILSEETQDRLDSLSKELETLKDNLDENVYINLKEANESFEKGCFLGVSLICGRVIKHSLDKINGKDINDKIESLKSTGLIEEKGGKDSIMKSNHFARNLTSHDLRIMSSSSEAISHLGDAIKISKIFREYENRLQEQEKKPTLEETKE